MKKIAGDNILGLAAIAVLTPVAVLTSFLSPSVAYAETSSVQVPSALPQTFYVNASENKKLIEKVDTAVQKRLYSRKLAETAWKESLQKQHDRIAESKNIDELSTAMAPVFASLNSSHCNFVTVNDEMYHFLHALFSDFNKKLNKGKVDYVGFVTGGTPFAKNQIRYVLDGSPAAKADLRMGDRILKVNGIDFVGYCNFLGTANTTTSIIIDRPNVGKKTIEIKPIKADLYTAYVEATKSSVKIDEVNGKKIGYVHVWCGGRRNNEALDEIIEDKFDKTDGLIIDLRDGYGGNSLSDLDRFYRDPKAYPDFVTVDRNGKKHSSRYYYEKPIVAIINGGSRSGKELVAFSLKRTGRATLVGTKTAGAVLAGSLTPLNEKCSAYIAVLDGTVGGVRLEGVGVEPDIEIGNKTNDPDGYQKQLSVARDTLLEMIR